MVASLNCSNITTLSTATSVKPEVGTISVINSITVSGLGREAEIASLTTSIPSSSSLSSFSSSAASSSFSTASSLMMTTGSGGNSGSSSSGCNLTNSVRNRSSRSFRYTTGATTLPTATATTINTATIGGTNLSAASSATVPTSHDYDYLALDTSSRRLRSYDEYSSQGSTGAISHDEESVVGTTAHRAVAGCVSAVGGSLSGSLGKSRTYYGNHLRSNSPFTSSRLGPLVNNNSSNNAKEGSVGRNSDYYMENSVSSNRRRYDRSPGKRERGLLLFILKTNINHVLIAFI